MIKRATRRLLSGAAATILALALLGVRADAKDGYPTRAIDVLTGFAPGGTTDLVARMAAQYLSKKWGVPINIINKPGGNTVPANVELYAAAPDGYTMFADNIGSSTMLTVSVPDLPFKIMDRTFTAMISSNSMLLMVAPNSPMNSLKEVAAEAAKSPEGFTWTGVGVAEVPMRQILRQANVDISKTKPVASSGSVSGSVLVAGGNVKFGIAAVGPSVSPVQAGLVKPIAVASEKRWPSLPNVPTAAEAGFPEVLVASWIGITGPPKLPDEVVQKWNEGISEMVKDPQIVEKLASMASVVDYKNPAQFREYINKELTELANLWRAK